MHSPVNVLVVDDDEPVRSSFAEILRSSGFSVMEAEDGEAALDVLRDVDVGMVLLDLKMPRMDGVALLDRLDHPPPIVVLSAFALDAQEQARVGGKVRAQLRKPVGPYRLLQVVLGTLRFAG
jgi:CheY-like chemotaxis protein